MFICSVRYQSYGSWNLNCYSWKKKKHQTLRTRCTFRVWVYPCSSPSSDGRTLVKRVIWKHNCSWLIGRFHDCHKFGFHGKYFWLLIGFDIVTMILRNLGKAVVLSQNKLPSVEGVLFGYRYTCYGRGTLFGRSTCLAENGGKKIPKNDHRTTNRYTNRQRSESKTSETFQNRILNKSARNTIQTITRTQHFYIY